MMNKRWYSTLLTGRRDMSASYNGWGAAKLDQLWTADNPIDAARAASVLRAAWLGCDDSGWGKIRKSEKMTQHTATNVLRVGNQMAIVVNMVLAGITCRLLCPHAQVVMVQGSQQQHWQEHCQ